MPPAELWEISARILAIGCELGPDREDGVEESQGENASSLRKLLRET